MADRIWYVNSTPASSIQYGLDVLSPRYFGGPPDVVLTGTNQGFNLGLAYLVSGTYGAAKYAISKGVPGLAFSAGDESIRPYTELGGPEDQANVYAEMIMHLLSYLEKSVKSGQPLLPRRTGLNVNFPSAVERGCQANDSKWVMSRLLASIDKSPVRRSGRNSGVRDLFALTITSGASAGYLSLRSRRCLQASH